MKITVNGQTKDYFGPPLLIGLLELLGIDHRAVVVERNLRIVPRASWQKNPSRMATHLKSLDLWEVVR